MKSEAKLGGTFYVWHDEGCCDNKTDDIEEARQIEKWLLDKGHHDVYIADVDGNVIYSPNEMAKEHNNEQS